MRTTTGNRDVSEINDFITEHGHLNEEKRKHGGKEIHLTKIGEIRSNEVSENEQGYSTKYYATKTTNGLSTRASRKENVSHTQQKEKDQIQNDLTGWTITKAPPLFPSGFSETKSPWQTTWKASNPNTRPINRVTATKIPYYKVTLPAIQTNPQTTDEIRLTGKEKAHNIFHNSHKLTKNSPVTVKTIPSFQDENKLYDYLNEDVDKTRFQESIDERDTINNNIEWLPVATASTPLATREQWHTALRTILNNMKYDTDHKGNYKPGSNKFMESQELGDDLHIPKSLRTPARGMLMDLGEGNKNINGKWSTRDNHQKRQSLVPFNLKSFATGQFQPGREYISLIDEDIRLMSMTTTTTTPEPRSTRKPEIFTIGGLLLKGKGDFYQTIGKNPKPIFVTPVLSSEKRAKHPAKKKKIKSVTWATAIPPKELVLNSEIMKNDYEEVDEGEYYVDNTEVSDDLYKDIDRYEGRHRNIFDSTIKHRYGLNGGNQRETVKPKNIYSGKPSSKTTIKIATTTFSPRKTAIIQKKTNSSNKDIMWGKLTSSYDRPSLITQM